MCMAAMGVIGGVMQLVGGGIAAAGAQREGAMAKRIANENALRLEKQGRYNARQIRRKASFVNGDATAQASANGLMIAGSAMDIIMDNAVQGEIDAANAQRNAKDQAHIQRLEGDAAMTRANNAAMGHIMGGFTGFLKAVA